MNVMAAAHDNAKENSYRSVKVAEQLMDAIVRGAGDAAQEFLKNYPNVDANILSSAKMTCLHVAAKKGQRELCTLLLDAGASLQMVDEKRNTPLHYAIVGNQPEIADLLLSRGAAVDAANNDRCSALHVAAKKGQRELCTLLLDAGASLQMVDEKRNTPLHYAIVGNQPEIADLLLSRGAAVDAANNDRCSALHVAAKSQLKLCTLLLDAGASLHLVDKDENTPLDCAVLANNQQIIELLLSRGTSINAVNSRGSTVLHTAIYNNCSRELCTLLLDAGASLHVADYCGNTPLHYANVNDNAAEVMDLLLSRGAAINSVDNERWSALHVAVCYLNVQCVKVLLRYHIDVNLQNSDGNTALHKLLHDPIPMWKGAMDIIDAICSCGRVDFTLRNEFGCNILHAAALRGNADAMERLVTHAHHLVDVQMEDGNAALHLAALKGHREVAAILLSQNGGRAKVDLRNNLGQTPLCLAVLHKHWPLVELLAHQKIADFDGTNMCNICMERRRNVAFLCGHCACEHCAAQLNTCHMCRKTITKKINLY